ncbi:hypothetical protein BJY01DRAFT_28218 [Aspergillus pseudoustus]|uniref:F-box domain-containing protein n=1 Tax=Aspergillus pseudoustus TaxID=1810923 RepID=A0ABR4JHH8_9EURO
MGGNLPFELIREIAQYRWRDPQAFLTKYALVCRQWQAAFEPFIYDKICIHSEDFKTEKGAISLARAEALTSNSHHAVARRTMIREILYRVILPFSLPDYHSLKSRTPEQTYTPHNATRQANNEAFEAGTLKLFNFLSSINAASRVTLRIETLAREDGHEPGTEVFLDSWGRPDEARGKSVVRPYRAEFADPPCPLPPVPCVDRLIADNSWYVFDKGPYYAPHLDCKHIRLETACYIAQACPTLSYFRWECDDPARPEHLDYARERREAFAASLLKLPATLRRFDLSSLTAEVLHDSLPAPALCPDGNDILSTNLRYITLGLQELFLYEVPLANDFLCPLDNSGEPCGDWDSTEWPNLEEISISCSNFLPSGEWLHDPSLTSEDPGIDIDALTNDPDFDYEEEVYRLVGDDVYYSRSVLKTELYLLANISLGYAARRMPRLRSMWFRYSHDRDVTMEFWKEEKERKAEATLMWTEGVHGDFDEEADGHGNGNGARNRPDERVARAWQFELEDLESEVVEGKRVSKLTLSSKMPSDR